MANENKNVDMYNLLHSEGDLWKSSVIAAIKAAITIKNESPATDHYEMKSTWANQVLANPDQWVNDNKWDILKNNIIINKGNESVDNDIETVVACLAPVPSKENTDKLNMINAAAVNIGIVKLIG